MNSLPGIRVGKASGAGILIILLMLASCANKALARQLEEDSRDSARSGGIMPVAASAVATLAYESTRKALDAPEICTKPFTDILGGLFGGGERQDESVKKPIDSKASQTPSATFQPPVISPIQTDLPDIDLKTPDYQNYQNAVIIYSATASDPNGRPMRWQWFYKKDGGKEVLYDEGTGAVQSARFDYKDAGTGSFEWILRVSDGMLTAQQTQVTQILIQIPSPFASAPSSNTPSASLFHSFGKAVSDTQALD